MDTLKTKKAYKSLPMEGLIATWYAKSTGKDLRRHKLAAAQIVEHIPAGGSVLEIAPGPGYFCIELAKLGNYPITGLDISKTFVEICRKNAAEAGVKVDFRLGNASDMPFEDETFDLTFCQAAFKNFSQPVRAIAEMYRVLRPNGTAVIIDMRRDATPAELDLEVKNLKLKGLDEIFTRWTFHNMLVKSAYSIPEMEAMIAQTPFGKGRIEGGGVGFSAWLTKGSHA